MMSPEVIVCFTKETDMNVDGLKNLTNEEIVRQLLASVRTEDRITTNHPSTDELSKHSAKSVNLLTEEVLRRMNGSSIGPRR